MTIQEQLELCRQERGENAFSTQSLKKQLASITGQPPQQPAVNVPGGEHLPVQGEEAGVETPVAETIEIAAFDPSIMGFTTTEVVATKDLLRHL